MRPTDADGITNSIEPGQISLGLHCMHFNDCQNTGKVPRLVKFSTYEDRFFLYDLLYLPNTLVFFFFFFFFK